MTDYSYLPPDFLARSAARVAASNARNGTPPVPATPLPAAPPGAGAPPQVVPGAVPPVAPPVAQPPRSPPGTQTTPIAGSLQGYTPATPNAAVPVGAVNGIDPVKVSPTSLQGYQPFIDAAMAQSKSRLDPQFQQEEAKFRQQMVGQGIPEGSQAFDDAYANFTRQKNDAYGSAMNAAMGQGLAAQGQAFGQGAQQTQLAQAMRQWSDQFGLNRDQMDLNAQGQFTQQDMDAYKLNMATDLQKWNMAQALLGMSPGMAPNQIDTYSPYGLANNAASFNAQSSANQSNGFWGAVGQLGAAYANSGNN